MKTEIVKVNASDYGLEESKAKEIESLFTPMLAKMSELENEYNDILKQEVDPETCQRAKDLRLNYVKIRTGTAEIHKKAKEFYLNGGRFVDGWKNAQIFASGEKEKSLKAIEDHFDNMERERIEYLRLDRVELLKPYTDIEPLALGHMEAEVFQNHLTGTKQAYEIRIAAEKKAEEDRIAAAKAEAERLEAQRLDNIRLQKEAEERERQIEAERQKARKEQERKDADLAKERAKAEAERKENELKASQERERYENLQAEIRAIEAAELKAKQDAEAKKMADEKAQKDAERKSKLAPDKDKLLAFSQALNDVQRPEIKSIEAAQVMASINGMLARLNQYILDNVNKL